MLVVHISMTPLAGAPIRIVNSLNLYSDFQCRLINLNPNHYGKRTFPEDLIWNKNKEEAIELISKADILHFHHFFDFESELNEFNFNFKQAAKNDCKFVRHFHSDADFVTQFDNAFKDKIINDKYPKIVIPHCAERTFLDAFVVPNIIPINDKLLIPKFVDNQSPIVFFSTTSKNSIWDTRWNTKGLPEVKMKFESLRKKEDFKFLIVENTPYDKCQEIKQNSNIVIGDITSGSYHLTDLEALSQGKPTFSYLDGRSQMILQNLLGCSDLPFINCRLEEIDLPFLELIRDKNLCSELGAFSRSWIEKYYNEKKLVSFFEEAYEKILNNESLQRQDYLINKKAKLFLYNDLYDMQWKSRKEKNQSFFSKISQKIKLIRYKIFSEVYSGTKKERYKSKYWHLKKII